MATTSSSTSSSSIDSSSSTSRRDHRLRRKNRDSIKIRKKRESRSKRRRRHHNGCHTSSSSPSDYRFSSSTNSSYSSSRPPSSPKEQGLDQDPQEEGVAIEAQKKASQRRPHLFFLFMNYEDFCHIASVCTEQIRPKCRRFFSPSNFMKFEKYESGRIGDPADSIYLEVELRRLSFLKETFAEGRLGNEFSPSSSMRALRREREMLCRQMQKKFPEKEREVLYRK
ncbi:hypothetical protein Syun_000844 [Stephania yunnanensis]|uniref:NPK1-activating kinesin-like protein C-terminal domain-containing protein n=1 Tax=Stephania yunnanensis TaxID=152371 RepID=A0AAP0LGQ6_9MAGN